MYVYIQTEPGLWTVGFFDPDGKWHTDSDHGDRESAARRVAYLNGATMPDEQDYDYLEDDSLWSDRLHRENQGCTEYDYPDHAFNDAGEYIP